MLSKWKLDNLKEKLKSKEIFKLWMDYGTKYKIKTTEKCLLELLIYLTGITSTALSNIFSDWNNRNSGCFSLNSFWVWICNEFLTYYTSKFKIITLSSYQLKFLHLSSMKRTILKNVIIYSHCKVYLQFHVDSNSDLIFKLDKKVINKFTCSHNLFLAYLYFSTKFERRSSQDRMDKYTLI